MIIKTQDESELINELTKYLKAKADAAIALRNNFLIGVSGGSLVKFLSRALNDIDSLSKWVVFFCDERLVPVDSEDSTFGAYKRQLQLANVHLRDEQFVQIKQGVSAEEAAKDYVRQMEGYFDRESLPEFDVLMLGMGPDGHTCSLFPGHELLEETSTWVAPIRDSPKHPPERITLTFPVINNAKAVVFAMAGASKADMLRRVLMEKEDLPATRVKPRSGELVWMVDKDAAKYLS